MSIWRLRLLPMVLHAFDTKKHPPGVDLDKIFNGLANGLRRRILQLLSRQGSMCFMDIARSLEVEDHTRVSFHLNILREAGFIDQTQDKVYKLTTHGQRVAACLSYICKSLET